MTFRSSLRSKPCFKCGATKPLSEFYMHGAMADMHFNKCKACARKDSAQHREKLKLDPEWVIRERVRSREKQRRKREEDRDWRMYA